MQSKTYDWWQSGVVYQIYPRSFQDTNGDGTGDLAGITQRIDYLANVLGVDAIWLSPFYPSPMADFGYDVSDYTNVDRLFGTLADFDALVRACHDRQIHVIIDFVPNHSSNQHPWFVESRSSRTNRKRDWYIWRDPAPDGGPPNNWVAVFGGSSWEYDATTGQYYLHSFLPEQPDLNWRNPEVRDAMFGALRFWLERGVDGFRVDAAHLAMKDPAFRDNPPNPDASIGLHKLMGDYDAQLHLYDRAHNDIHELYQGMRAVLDEYSTQQPRMMVGEIHIFDWEEWARYFGPDLDEFHLPFNFALLGVPWTARDVRAVVDGLEAALPIGGWPNYVLGNHDESRVASRIGSANAALAMTLLLTLRGTPTIYYGDELGMTDVAIPPSVAQDPWGKHVPGLNLGRDPERTPMQWDASPNAGFCPPSVTPWLPMSPNYPIFNVEAEMAQPTSLLALTRNLLALRRSTPALSVGEYRPVDGTPEHVYAYLRLAGDARSLVVLNFGPDPITINMPGLGRGMRRLSTTERQYGEVDLAAVELAPHEAQVFDVFD